jgi:ABC-type branched-subunit amino acid transport system substrate-binding protein
MKRRSRRTTKSPAVVNKKWLARQQRPFKPTEKQRGAVEALAGQGFRHEDIARLIMNPHTGSGISPVTLRQHFREELDRGPPKANDENTLTIGMTLSQTGSLNVDSVAQQRGADMWRDEVNAAGGIKRALL